MIDPAPWEMVLIGVVVLVALLWLGPGIKNMLEESRQAEQRDWPGALIPIAVVVAFVVLLIMMAR